MYTQEGIHISKITQELVSILLSFSFLTIFSHLSAQTLIETKDEENTYIDFLVGRYNESISQEMMDALINRIKSIYSPIIKEEKGKNLEIYINWSRTDMGARFSERGNQWSLVLDGGNASHPYMTLDSVAVILCHEIGHFLGGPPMYPPNSMWGWFSVHGQADYFATSQCLRKYFEGQENQSIISEMPIPRYVTAKCQDNFSDPEDIALCQRGAMAPFATIVAYLNQENRDELKINNPNHSISFQTPDTSIAKETFIKHPTAQCRLDTYFQGILCNDLNDDGICIGPNGQRPRCWFNPTTD